MVVMIDGHKIVVNRYIRTMVLSINDKVVDKVEGFFKILDENLELHGSLSSGEKITVLVINKALATKIIIKKDDEVVKEGYMV